MEKSLTSLRNSRAISAQEVRIKRLSILSHLLEMKGYHPSALDDTIELTLIVKKVARAKWSPEKGAIAVVKLISEGELSYNVRKIMNIEHKTGVQK